MEHTQPPHPHQHQPQPTNIARLCGNYRSTCGYCDGSRAEHLCQHLRHQGRYYDSSEEDDSLEYSSSTHTRTIYNARNSSKCYAASFDVLCPNDYQALLYQGWRRSGQHLYVPDNWRSCCPAIPIRLNVREFVRDKKQRRVWRNMDRALNGVGVPNDGSNDGSNGDSNGDSNGNGNEGRKRNYRRSNHKVNVPAEDVLEYLKCQVVRAVLLYDKENRIENNVGDTINEEEEEEEKGNRIKSRVKFKVRMLSKSERKMESHCNLNRERENRNVVAVYTAVCHLLLASNKNTEGIILVEDDMDAKTLGRKIVSCLQQHSSLSSSSSVKSYTNILSSVVITDSGHICFYVPTTSSQEEEEKEETHQQQQQNINSSSEDKATMKQLLDIIGRRESSKKNHKINLPLQPHKMTVRSIPSNLSGTMADVHELHARYQAAVHGDVNPYEKLRLWRQRQQNKKHTSGIHPPNPTRSENGNVDRVTLQGHDENGDDDVDENESLSKIQQAIHTSRINFRRFLCDSPLPPVDIHSTGNKTMRALFNVDEDGYDFKIPYGSYHQHYRIDNVLVAVGVIDVLPHGVSSVYSFYDPILSGNRANPKKMDCTKRKDVNPSMKLSLTLNLELGKYTALREIEWTRRASLYRPSLCNYFLGFYIHSCTKMRYKAEYKPSKLLCPISKKWIDYEDAKPHMDANWGCCALINEVSAHSPRTHAALPVADHNRNGDVKMNGSNKSSSSFSIINMRLDLGQKRSRPSSNNGISNGSSNGRVQGNVTVGMLTSYGRAVVDPLVKDFVRHVGEDVARHCVLKLQ